MNNLIIVMWVVGAVSIAVLATRTSRGDAIATALMMLMVMSAMTALWKGSQV